MKSIENVAERAEDLSERKFNDRLGGRREGTSVMLQCCDVMMLQRRIRFKNSACSCVDDKVELLISSC